MEIIKRDGVVEIHGCDDFEPNLIFDCGQCFRWDNNGIGIAGGKIAKVVRENDIVKVNCNTDDFDAFWADYFDISLDYAGIRNNFMTDTRMAAPLSFGKGIRILRQEPWEALVSFIISQCNNIPRIRGIIEKLCTLFGDEITYGEIKRFSFPDAKRLAVCTLSDLEPLRAGYRAKYILHAAQRVSSGEANLEKIAKLPTNEARAELLKFQGVGNKVADCTLLFGMGKYDAFPVDVWMKRALSEFFDNQIPDFGEYAGIAQQYIFHYIRNKANPKK